MLATTLATVFTPGTNMEGDVPGANWVFLLPSLELEQIVCIGSPRPTTLMTLSRIGHEVVVICTNSRQLQKIGAIGERHGLPNLRPIAANGCATLPLPDGTADLVVLTDRSSARRLNRGRALSAKLQRLLKPEGLIYFEIRGLIDRLLCSKAINSPMGEPQLFWMTPLSGEALTATPLDDHETIRYFLRRKLYSASIDLGIVRRTKGFLDRYGLYTRVARPCGVPERWASARMARRSPRRSQSIVQNAGVGLQSAMQDVESFLRTRSRFTWRCGVLVRRTPAPLSHQPPQYLRSIAHKAGIDIDKYGWGLSAPGDYSSRKVLFFFVDRASGSPEYIVKLTRDRAFNPRLENEYRALSLLREKGIGNAETLPRPVFFGYHSHLAIIGETAIDGASLRGRITVDNHYSLEAIDWLIKLGAATANSVAVTSEQVAHGLDKLFGRFTELYRLTSEQHTFLTKQITIVERNRQPFPLVFQHGDPGTWNIMVTRTGRVAFLDWEAADPQGMPLWDLFYFLRSYSVQAARARGIRDRLEGFEQQLLTESPFSSLLIESTRRYCRQLGLSEQLVEPLFYTCWMHRALKASTRLRPVQLEGSHYVNLLQLCIDYRRGPTLSRLFSLV